MNTKEKADQTDKDRDFLVMQVAYLVSQNMRQDKIRELLQLKNQTEVSRLLAEAVESKRIKRWVLTLSPEDLKKAERCIFTRREQLMAKLKKLALENKGIAPASFTVVYIPEDIPEKERLAYFGRHAADPIIELIQRDATKKCAVAWGRTIKSIIDAIPGQARIENLQFVPVAGEPSKVADVEFSPTVDARRLANAFGCKSLSLSGAAARIPKKLGSHIEIIKKFVSSCSDYEEIFAGKKPIIEEVDMILTGVGDAATSKEDPWFMETQESENIEDLDMFAAGNISGVWIPKDPRKREHKERIEEMNSRWLGIQKKHLDKCAKNAEGGRPGVVVVAMTAPKAQIVSRVMGMVNHLVIDRQLADAILDG